MLRGEVIKKKCNFYIYLHRFSSVLIASAPFNSAVITLEGRETGRVRVQVGAEHGGGVVVSNCL